MAARMPYSVLTCILLEDLLLSVSAMVVGFGSIIESKTWYDEGVRTQLQSKLLVDWEVSHDQSWLPESVREPVQGQASSQTW